MRTVETIVQSLGCCQRRLVAKINTASWAAASQIKIGVLARLPRQQSIHTPAATDTRLGPRLVIAPTSSTTDSAVI
jgi:hypothetical protein